MSVSFLMAALPGAASAADDGLAIAGRKLAQSHCSRCHVVGNHNPMGGISSTPSFSLLVNRLSDWHERFSSFYARLPHPSIIRMEGVDPPPNHLQTSYPVHLKLEHVDAIIQFVATLKK